MPPKPRQTTRGLYGMPVLSGLLYRFTTFIFTLLSWAIWRSRLDGLDRVPKTDPYLLLPNHASMLDPFWVGIPINRGVRPMASAGLLRVPILGSLLKFVGCFPKEKFTKDIESMKMLQRNYDDGYVVLLFPEGNRSWNGETAAINPGIGRLIKRMGCKVVYARINSGYLFHPRWARYPRWVPIEATYDGPHEYPEQSAEQITADVQARLQVKPHLKKPARVWGFRMAHGLPDYLWACPKCIAIEALEVPKRRGNTVRCRACEAEWEIDVYSMLNGSSTLSVGDAFRQIESGLGAPPVVDAEQLEETGIILSGPAAQLFSIPRKTNRLELELEGEVELHREGLRILGDGAVIWETPFAELKGISIEVANTLHFRVNGVLYRLVIPEQSPLKWEYFLRKWRLHTVGSEH